MAELVDPFKTQRPNAVLAERSCYDVVDRNATHSTAALQLARALEKESRDDCDGKAPKNKKSRVDDTHDADTFWSKVFTTWLAPCVHCWLEGKTRNAMSKACKAMSLRTEGTSTIKAALNAFAKLPVASRRLTFSPQVAR